MQTTGIFETHRRIIDVPENETITLIPFGDIHYGAPLHASETFDRWIDWAQSQKNPYYLGMGDYTDMASSSNRMVLTSRALHESTRETLDGWYRDEAEAFAEKIKFMADDKRLIGMIEGNHYGELISGQTTTMYMCEKLRTKYLGVSCFLRIQMQADRANYPITVWAHHGQGGARLVGGSLNRVQQMAEHAEADIYLMGHDHKRSIGTANRLYLTPKLDLRHKTIMFARTGSFLSAYVKGKASYIADTARGPSDLGGISVELTPRRDKSKGGRGRYVDMRGTI